MNRRDLLKSAALLGVSVLGPAIPRRARAVTSRHNGPFWVMVHASGGWDPTLFCDPKGNQINQSYQANQIVRQGAFSFAPLSATTARDDSNAQIELDSNQRFFATHAARLTVINGLDVSTNSHETGVRCTWSGRITEGFPSLAALVAAKVTRETPVPIPFLSGGGYDVTAGLVAATRTSSPEILRTIAYPGRADASAPETQMFSTAAVERIAQRQQARLQRLEDAAALPVQRRAMSRLFLARNDASGIEDLAAALPTNLVEITGIPGLSSVAQSQWYKLDDLRTFCRQSQVALTAFQTGVAVSANLQINGFDTHANHERDHLTPLMKLWRGLDYLWTTAAALGIADRLNVVVGSDFGRTPSFNGQNGKDHWPVTSMLLMGQALGPGRVLGGTDDGFAPRSVDTRTLQPVASGGVQLKSAHVHKALRRLAGLDGTDLAQRFPLAGEDLPIFG